MGHGVGRMCGQHFLETSHRVRAAPHLRQNSPFVVAGVGVIGLYVQRGVEVLQRALEVAHSLLEFAHVVVRVKVARGMLQDRLKLRLGGRKLALAGQQLTQLITRVDIVAVKLKNLFQSFGGLLVLPHLHQ